MRKNLVVLKMVFVITIITILGGAPLMALNNKDTSRKAPVILYIVTMAIGHGAAGFNIWIYAFFHKGIR